MDICTQQVEGQIMPITFDDKNEILSIGDWQDVEIEVTSDSGACKSTSCPDSARRLTKCPTLWLAV